MQQAETKLRTISHQETSTSFDNTPHPSVKHCAGVVNAMYPHGRPGQELVPSRYALKVGAIDVMVISDGCYRCQARCWATTSTRPSGRPGWRTCSCRRTCSSGRDGLFIEHKCRFMRDSS